METMIMEIELERVWSDGEELSQAAYSMIEPEPAAGKTRETVRLEGAFERVWSDDDALTPITALKKAA